MSMLRDLLGEPDALTGYSPRAKARQLYAEGDLYPAGSLERIGLYREAAEWQRKADRADAMARKRRARLGDVP